MHRRDFFRAAGALPATFASEQVISRGTGSHQSSPVLPDLVEYERALSATTELASLGIPQSWSSVREGFHPFSPERMVIMGRNRLRALSCRHTAIKEKVEDKCSRWKCSEHKLRYSAEKFGLLMSVIDLLVDYYRVPNYFEDWAVRLALREQLGTTGSRHGFGFVHQFQRKEEQIVPTVVNPPVDWWLFLFPAGVDYEGLDEKPVFALIGHVVSRLTPRREVEVLELASRLAYAVPSDSRNDDTGAGWRAISRLDRVRAARTLNQLLACHLRKPGPR